MSQNSNSSENNTYEIENGEVIIHKYRNLINEINTIYNDKLNDVCSKSSMYNSVLIDFKKLGDITLPANKQLISQTQDILSNYTGAKIIDQIGILFLSFKGMFTLIFLWGMALIALSNTLITLGFNKVETFQLINPLGILTRLLLLFDDIGFSDADRIFLESTFTFSYCFILLFLYCIIFFVLAFPFAKAEYFKSKVENRKEELDTKKNALVSEINEKLKDINALINNYFHTWTKNYYQEWQSKIAFMPVFQFGKFTNNLAQNCSAQLDRNSNDDLDFTNKIYAFVPFPGEANILIKAEIENMKQVVHSIQSILLRFLIMIPPGKLRFTFIDPDSKGVNVKPFINLKDFDENLINSQAWYKTEDIEKRLIELQDRMSSLIHNNFGSKYESIEAYNEESDIPEPYYFLLVMDFPSNFSEESVNRLVDIVKRGQVFGIYTFIIQDMHKSLPYGISDKELTQSMHVVKWNNSIESYVWDDKDFKDYSLELDQPPEPELFDSIINKIGEAAMESGQVKIPFDNLLKQSNLTESDWWKSSTEIGIKIPLGSKSGKQIQYLELGKGTSHHALISGTTGSGKSNLLHVLITNLILSYSPNEIELYLIDFKGGVEFNTYAEFKIPHARVIAVDSEREFGLSVLKGLHLELEKREILCRDNNANGLKEYREKTNKNMPRVLMLVDEFQAFFQEDDTINYESLKLFDQITRKGRAFGIHIILASQTLPGDFITARSTREQIGVRIALKCSEDDSRLVLGEDNPDARMLTQSGAAIYNENGLQKDNSFFQVALLKDTDRDNYIKQLITNNKQSNFIPSEQQMVFRGNELSKPEDNLALNKLLSQPYQSDDSKKVYAWLGEPIAMKEKTTAVFRRQSGSNLMIVGRNPELSISILLNAIFTLSAQPNPKFPKFYILDFGNVDEPNAHIFSTVAQIMKKNLVYGKRRKMPEIMNEIYETLEKRMDQESEGLSKNQSVYLIIYGLQRARDLEPSDNLSFDISEDTPAMPEPSELFPKILLEGSEFGVHTLIWCDTATNMNRIFDRRSERQFDMRIVFQMSEDDSLGIIESPSAAKLGANRALYYSEEEATIEKFRPFSLGSEEWIKTIAKNLS